MTRPREFKDILRLAVARTGSPVWRRLRPRIESIAERQAQHAILPLQEELARTRQALQQQHELGELRAAHDALRGRTDMAENDIRRIGAHVAAADTRLAVVERTLTTPIGDERQHEQARTLIEDIRGEHAKIRARLTAVASYEERIGRLENATRG